MKSKYFEIDETGNKVLQFLVSERWFRWAKIQEMSRIFNNSWNTISKAVSSLGKKGLITNERGIVKIKKDNPANYYFKFFIDQLRIQNLNERLSSIISYTKSNAESVTHKNNLKFFSLLVFGSVASGQDTPESDIDLFVIIEDPGREEKLEKLKSDIITKKHIGFDNINIIIMSNKEFERGYLEADDLIISILSNNLLVKDDGFLQTFMERELFIPSHKTIFARIEELEKNKDKLLDLIKIGYLDELKKEFQKQLIKEARVELLSKRRGIVATTKEDVIKKIRSINNELYKEIKNIDKGNIKQKVLKYVNP